jgi:hypothetical protein
MLPSINCAGTRSVQEKTSTYEQTEPKYNPRFGGRAATPGERTLAGLKREFDDTRQSVFAMGTLGAVNFVVGGMKDLPGRKSIMLLSDGFRLYSEDANGFREYAQVMDSLRRTVDSANRASVVIYSVEARGLRRTVLRRLIAPVVGTGTRSIGNPPIVATR